MKRRKRAATEKKKPNTQIFAIIAMAAFMLLIATGIAGFFRKPEERKPMDLSNVIKPEEFSDPEEIEFYGVVLAVDTTERKIYSFDVEKNVNVETDYDGATKFFGSAGTQITAALLHAGDLLHFTCREAQPETLAYAAWDNDVWEKNRIDDLKIKPEENRMVIRNSNYRYSDGLCIMNNGVRVNMNTLLPTADRYTIRGKGSEVFEIVVTTGHGILQLTNFEDYVGGLVKIGQKYALDINAPGIYVVREGSYTVEASYGRLNAIKSVEIPRDGTVIFDLGPYGQAAQGTPIPPVTATPTPAPTPLPDNFNINIYSLDYFDGEEYEYDSKHKVTVYGPAGGDLYLDGYLLGTLPCSFEKVKGQMDLTVMYDGLALTFKYNGAAIVGDISLDYTRDFKEE